MVTFVIEIHAYKIILIFLIIEIINILIDLFIVCIYNKLSNIKFIIYLNKTDLFEEDLFLDFF